MRDYLFESERYLRGVMPDRHDPCCEAERARREHFAVMQAALHLRVDSVRSAITALGFTLEDSTKDFNEP